MRDATLSRFVSGIYDAVIDPALWQPAIETIRVEFRFHIAVLAVNKVPSGDGVIFAFCNVPDEYARTLGNYGADIVEAWGGVQAIARLPLEEPLVTSEVRPIQHWKNNRFYLEWMKPQGIVGEVAMILASDRTTNANLGLSVHESRGPIEPETIADLRLLGPHLARAVRISRLLDMTTNAAATFEGALAAMASGAVLVNADMTIVYANPVAQEMLRLPTRSGAAGAGCNSRRCWRRNSSNGR